MKYGGKSTDVCTHRTVLDQDFEHLWDILKITGVCSSDGLHVDGSVLALVGEMSEERKVVILKVMLYN